MGEEVAALDAAGADIVHWDVMDGVFVPNITFGPHVVKACRSYTDLPFEAHLMVQDACAFADRWVDAGCSRLIVHPEAEVHLHRTLGHINSLGASAAVVLNPATPATAIAHVLDLIDLVLVMTVNPGFGGQSYLPTMEPKIAEIRRMIDDRRVGRPDRRRGRRWHRQRHDRRSHAGRRQRVRRRVRGVRPPRRPRGRDHRAARAGERRPGLTRSPVERRGRPSVRAADHGE
jgi:ribulose-phosphate 3-epimerase